MTLTCLNHGAGLRFQSAADQLYTLRVRGPHPNLSEKARTHDMQIFYAARILYSFAIASIKFSILLLYLRLFPSLWVRRGAKTIMITCTSGCTILLFLWVFKCKPVPKAWDLNEAGTCVHRGSLFQAHAIFSLLINVMIILLPMPTLWGLHMPLRRRALVMAIFGIGLM